MMSSPEYAFFQKEYFRYAKHYNMLLWLVAKKKPNKPNQTILDIKADIKLYRL